MSLLDLKMLQINGKALEPELMKNVISACDAIIELEETKIEF